MKFKPEELYWAKPTDDLTSSMPHMASLYMSWPCQASQLWPCVYIYFDVKILISFCWFWLLPFHSDVTRLFHVHSGVFAIGFWWVSFAQSSRSSLRNWDPSPMSTAYVNDAWRAYELDMGLGIKIPKFCWLQFVPQEDSQRIYRAKSRYGELYWPCHASQLLYHHI